MKDPIAGKYEWVVSFDLNSLYPNIIVQNNMSPETIMDHIDDPKSFVRAANETYYRKDFQGVLPQIIEEYYDERVLVKKMMLDAKSQAQKDYRQALRDLPSTAKPKLDENGQLTNVTWPTKPT